MLARAEREDGAGLGHGERVAGVARRVAAGRDLDDAAAAEARDARRRPDLGRGLVGTVGVVGRVARVVAARGAVLAVAVAVAVAVALDVLDVLELPELAVGVGAEAQDVAALEEDDGVAAARRSTRAGSKASSSPPRPSWP